MASKNRSNGNGGRKVAASARKRINVTGNDHQQIVALFQQQSIAKRWGPLHPLAYGVARLFNTIYPVTLSLSHTNDLLTQFNHSTRSGHGIHQSIKTITKERRKLSDDTTVTRITTTTSSDGHVPAHDIRLALSMTDRRNIIALLQKHRNKLRHGFFRAPVYWFNTLFNRIEHCDMTSVEIEAFLYSISN